MYNASSGNCGTCIFSKEMENDYLNCEKYGKVTRYHTCSNYQFDLTMQQPPKKRTLDTSRFSKEDFSID